MEKFSDKVITNLGRELIASTMQEGGEIEFVYFAIGDGAKPTNPEEATSLSSELFDAPISSVIASSQSGVTLVKGNFSNTAGHGDFTWRELGLYAKIKDSPEDAILFGYAHAGENADYIGTVEDGAVYVQDIVLAISVGSASVQVVENMSASATFADIRDVKIELRKELSIHTGNTTLHITADERAAWNAMQPKKLGTASRVVVTDGSGNISASGITTTILGHLSGVTSNIQTQLNDKASNTSLTSHTGNTTLHITADERAAWNSKLDTHAVKALLAELIPVGSLIPSACASMPGWLLCNGQAVSRTTYKNLFNAIRTTYGAGNGTTTFNLPNFCGRTLWGADSSHPLGSTISAGLRNITGRLPLLTLQAPELTGGAFASTQNSTGLRGVIVEGWSTGDSRVYPSFDASRNGLDPVYGKSDSVQPPAIAVNVFIKC